MFKKRYEEYVQENDKIVRGYRERGILLEFDTGREIEQSWKNLYNTLEMERRWIDIIH